jgi:Ca2+-binding EF-hand superfamily protein
VSLFNFLDKDQNGYLSFEEMLYKIIPGATKEHVNKMLSWVKEEDEISGKAVVNYKMPLLSQKK